MKKRLPLVLHVLLWVGLLAFSLWTHFNFNQPKIPTAWLAVEVAQTMAFHLALFYFNWCVLLPFLLARGKVVAYALAVVATLVLYAGLRSPVEISLKKEVAERVPALAAEIKKHPLMVDFKTVMFQLAIIGVMNIFLSSALKVTGDYLRNERRRKELELQHTTTELELLKAQVNPHFLFNTLNNIYSLAYQNSPATPDAILKLSMLLRYQLYETNTAVVPLAREVEHLEHLLDLHRLRLTDPSLLNLQVTGDLSSAFIPPMLLMPMVENMFKHGLTTAPMQLDLTVQNNTLLFTTRNKVKPGLESKESFGGIGWQNLKRRLEPLYPQAHTFTAHQTDQDYIASLTLTRLS